MIALMTDVIRSLVPKCPRHLDAQCEKNVAVVLTHPQLHILLMCTCSLSQSLSRPLILGPLPLWPQTPHSLHPLLHATCYHADHFRCFGDIWVHWAWEGMAALWHHPCFMTIVGQSCWARQCFKSWNMSLCVFGETPPPHPPPSLTSAELMALTSTDLRLTWRTAFSRYVSV